MSIDPSADPKSNRILGLLPASAAQVLLPALEPVVLAIATILYWENVDQEYVYFPGSGIVSLVYMMHDGSTSELAVVGNDGVVGLLAIMGGGRTTSRAVVQVAGRGWRLPRRILIDALAKDLALRQLLDRYTMVLFAQMAQTAVCNRHHTVTQQLCRWLLMSLDRIESSHVRMTQQLIADMLGVRREGVSAIAGELKAAGLIDYSRGEIAVLDRRGLEQRACECYSVVVAEYERLLATPLAKRPLLPA